MKPWAARPRTPSTTSWLTSTLSSTSSTATWGENGTGSPPVRKARVRFTKPGWPCEQLLGVELGEGREEVVGRGVVAASVVAAPARAACRSSSL